MTMFNIVNETHNLNMDKTLANNSIFNDVDIVLDT